MTSGGQVGTGGLVARWEGRAILVLIAVSLAQNLINVATIRADRANQGLSDLGWQPWLWELSSWAGLTAMLPFALRAARAFRPPLLPWAAVPLAHLPVSMLFSGGHVAIMLAIRQVVYSSMGRRYDFFGDSPAGTLLYEFRKDILFYAGAVAVLLLVRALAESRIAPAAADRARIEVRDGARTVWLAPEDILSVAAAGNYVEVATAGQGVLLHRATLGAMEARLAPHGFARIHRSRLVRRGAVRELRGASSGDFELVLTDGRIVQGSRRYRDRLQL